MAARHIVWDWNGTLLNDAHVVYQATSSVLVARGLAPVTPARYRATNTRPISVFYARLLGVEPTRAEMAEMDRQFHAEYRRALLSTELTGDAREVLAGWRAAGGTQSLLSMFRHAELLPLVRRHGIAEEFVRIDGLVGAPGGHKAGHLRRHLAALGGPAAGEVVVIGDSLDDAAAADNVGVRCVLYDGGSHERDALEAAGVPVADTLAEAVHRAGGFRIG